MADILHSIYGSRFGIGTAGELVLDGVAATFATNVANGTVSSPSIAFSSDTNTGFYRISADLLGIAAGGVEKIRVGTGALTFNNGAADVDFTVKKLTTGNVIAYDAGADTLAIGATTNTVAGNVTFADGTTDVDIASHDSTNGLKLGGTLIAATALEINRACDVSTRIVVLATSTSITVAAHDGKVILLTGTGAAYTQTLPAATGSGARFRFVVGAVNTSNHVINVTGDDVMYGQVITCSTSDTPDLAQPWVTAADSDTITLNGTTTGGAAVGGNIELIDIASDKWLVIGFTTTSGTEATPFSAAVS